MRFIWIFLFSFTLCAGPVAWREITLPPNPGKLSVTLRFFMPENYKGFRLTDASGKILPVSVTDISGSGINLFFAPVSSGKLRLTFYTEKIKNPPARQRSGVLHLYREYRGNMIRTEPEFRRAWTAAGTPVRAGWENGIYTGLNRLGRSNKSLNIYTGFFRIEQKKTLFFHTASTDASFLLIDGKVIASYPGYHGVHPALYGDFKGKVTLMPGIHKLEYLHANAQWTYYAIAASSAPGAKRMNILRKNFFLPLPEAKAGPLLALNGKKLPDHSWNLEHVIDIDGMQMSCYRVDGGKRHYFFDPRESEMLDGFRLQNRYHYSAPLVSGKAGSMMLNDYLKQNEKKRIPPQACRMLAAAIPVFKDKAAGMLFYDKIVRDGDRMPPEYIFKFYRAMILEPRLDQEQYELAVKELEPMLNKNRSGAGLELAKIWLYGIGHEKKAESYFKQIDFKALTAAMQKEYLLLQADLALFLRGYEASAELYGKMDSMTKTMSARRLVESEGALLSLRNALITKRYQDAMSYLEQIGRARPEIRINPEMMLLKARFLEALGRPRRAAVLYRALLLTHPANASAAAALFALGKMEWNRGEKKAALLWFERLKQEFPDSRESAGIESVMR